MVRMRNEWVQIDPRFWDVGMDANINIALGNGDTPNYETIEDTLVDLANYAIIGLMVQRGQWAGIESGKG